MKVRKPIATVLILVFILLLTSCGNQQTKIRTAPEKQFIGSINGDKYHYPNCEWAQRIKPENEVWFSSPAEAREAGYKPCKACEPPPR